VGEELVRDRCVMLGEVYVLRGEDGGCLTPRWRSAMYDCSSLRPKLTYMNAPYIQRNEMARNVVITANINRGMEKMTRIGGKIKRSGLNHRRLILYDVSRPNINQLQAYSEWLFSICSA
jgi:hypothetical protein